MRYIPITREEKSEMLSAIGVASVDNLFADIGEDVLLKAPLNIPGPMDEFSVMRHLGKLASANSPVTGRATFLGGGSYNHFIPSAVDHTTSRSEWYSAYTPYQPEISQGTLQAIYEFQSYVTALFGMEVSNASMYDGASALAEAVLMACRAGRKNEIVMSNLIHPRWRDTIRTFTKFKGTKLIETPDHQNGRVDVSALASAITADTAAVVVQSPNFFGNVEDLAAIGEICREKKVLFIVGVAEAMSLGLLKAPGDFGADIVVGDGQSFGIPLSFGGPYVGMFATSKKFMRQMPGRLCGKTEDLDGKPGFVLTLAAREQHIRREKATSNICTNQALCALRVTIFLSLLGKEGLAQTARANFNASAALKERIDSSSSVQSVFDHPFFNEQLVAVNRPASAINAELLEKGVIGGLDVSRFYPDMENKMLLAATETALPEDIDTLMEILEGKR